MNIEIKRLENGLVTLENNGRVAIVAKDENEMTEALLQALFLLQDNNIEGYGASQRSSGWRKVRGEVVEERKKCECCQTKQNLDVHHIEPFHLAPEKELDKKNLIVLCSKCHFLIGHLCNWKSFNIDVVQDAQYLCEKIRNRP